MKISSFKDLRIWQEARALVLLIYRCTNVFPSSEIYGLTSQMRRAAISVSANIAEGESRNTRREYINFLFMARGSARELLSHCLIAKDLGYLDERLSEELVQRYDGLSAGIYMLIKKLKTPIERSN